MLSRVLCKGQGKQSGTRIQRFNFYLGSMLVYFFCKKTNGGGHFGLFCVVSKKLSIFYRFCKV